MSTVRRKLKASTVCPHCWHRFAPDETMWIAAHPDLLGDRLLSPEDPVRFLPSRFSPAGEAIDPGGERTRRLACPRCHLEIPQLLLEKKMTITSIVGSPSSGKSYFIASAMWKLREDLARLFSVAFTDTDPAMNRSVTENEARLFLSEDRSASVHIDKTELEGSQYDSVQFDPGVSTLLARPHIFTLRPARDHVNGHAPEQATHLLTLYDNAGEHFFPGADSARAPGTQHLAQAEALMFVFDPTQDVRFRQRLGSVSRDPQLAAGAKVTRQDQLIVEMARRVRVHGGLAPHERVPKPLFVVLSKSDIWGPLLVDESGAKVDITSAPYWRERAGLGKVGIRRIDATSARVRALLAELAPEVVAAAEDAFERVIYVPVSAIGTSPVLDPASGLLKVPVANIAPRWVTVPFLYTLARWSKQLIGHDLRDHAGDPGDDGAAEREGAAAG
jgi:hypothetical protein